jgi:Holliday junction resolvasome RuvABC DNA-binding subunit
MAAQIHLRQLESRSALSTCLDTAARALRSLGFREPDVRRVMPTLETKLGKDAPIETVIREALLLLT